MLTARTAVATMAGSLAWHLHAQHAPRLATGTVPILDMIELRNRGAHLLFRAQRLLGPLAKGITRAAIAKSAWREWGPAAGGGARSLSAHLVIGRTEVYPGFSIRPGWLPATRSPLGCAGRAVSGETDIAVRSVAQEEW